MQTVTKREDVKIREGNPRGVKLSLCANHPFLTFSGECDCFQKTFKIRYAMIGTAYGWLHNSAGDIRMWNSESAVRRAAKKYLCF